LPHWQPQAGWRIDPALAYAHARQESDFRRGAVSPAGAVGLMQVRPGTAGDLARARGTAVGELSYPPINLEYGQSFIELMRSKPETQGQLLKVVAAYNAGPLPVARWNYINAKDDPLLWIESLPYWETRYYVPAVIRNMWVYQGLEGSPQPTLKALAEHKWPSFPTRGR
jgi:soluble lytic murein transglycosylase-like protein